ncbi:MAG: hypothetical protein AUK47_08630 [Deltaproteobacteria bacterium CG2_30_63_29]|nr:MAG: hypothetical protein AUK47_08630 [Deltaproteobacteria bacterium CG2_30_63_29]PIW01956.1 MAG: hypothetical protein COW42_03270 [Deltaproteobacteria bacterium CG17_big_fil_post_rev_8_21_14_2_50_63_7]
MSMHRVPFVAHLVALLLLLTLAPSSLLAQEDNRPVIDVTPAQREINDRAFKATADGSYDRAIDLLTTSNSIQELNITYLNLGRALTKAGRCDEAAEAYAKVMTAPVVPDPSPDAVYGALTKYLEELGSVCPGKVLVSCDPPTMRVSVDDKPPTACTIGPISLPGGEYTITGRSDVGEVSSTVRIAGMQEIKLVLKTVKVEQEVVPEEEGGMGLLATAGWATGAAGVGVLAAAFLVEVLVLGPGIDELESAAAARELDRMDGLKSQLDSEQTLNSTLYIAGGTLLGAGVVMVGVSAILDAIDEANETSSGVDLWLAPDVTGLSWSLTF